MTKMNVLYEWWLYECTILMYEEVEMEEMKVNEEKETREQNKCM